jgi:hypothetical protein
MPKTAKTSATVLVAATPRATAATALTMAVASSRCRADPCWLRASIRRRDHVDQRIEDEQHADADRQGVRHRREDGGLGEGDDPAGKEELQGPCFAE